MTANEYLVMAGVLVALGAFGTDWSRGWPPRPYPIPPPPDWPKPRWIVFYLMLFVAPVCVLLAIIEFATSDS